VAPDIVKPAPDSVAALTVTDAVPEEVKVRVLVEVVFRVTLPKANVLALTVKFDETPVPLRLTVLVLPLDELLAMVIVPLAAPATVGSKLTWSVLV
jgi:hypothetical protein